MICSISNSSRIQLDPCNIVFTTQHLQIAKYKTTHILILTFFMRFIQTCPSHQFNFLNIKKIFTLNHLKIKLIHTSEVLKTPFEVKQKYVTYFLLIFNQVIGMYKNTKIDFYFCLVLQNLAK